MTLRRNDVLLLLGILVAFAVAAAIQTRRVAEPVVPVAAGYASTDVTSGGYAAFAELLAREGVRAGTFDRHPGELDEHVDTLIDAYAPFGAGPPIARARTDADLDDLRGWVERGGRLVVLGVDARSAPRERVVLGRPFVIEATAPGRMLAGPLATGLAVLAPRGRVRFAVNPAHARVELADDGGPLVVDVALGRGTVRYFNAAQLFTNRNIARADNARLALALVRPVHPGGLVLFDEGLHGEIVDPSVWSIAPVWLRIVMTGLALTVILALAGGALRLGPRFHRRRASRRVRRFSTR
jgi:hypothetical protein